MEGLSICITTRNNLECLRLCLRGLEEHSRLRNETLIHVDGSTDGTLEWLRGREMGFTHSEWGGLYSGWNSAAQRATKDYMILLSDDMFVGPNWDLNLRSWRRENWVIVPRLVEPFPGSYPPVYDCGRDPGSFDEGKFVQYAVDISEKRLRPHTFGAFCMSTERFKAVAGFDKRFDPIGVGSIDLITTLAEAFPDTEFYEALDVIIYHFQSGAVSKIPNKDELDARSVRRFEEKWGFGVDEAYRRLEGRV